MLGRKGKKGRTREDRRRHNSTCLSSAVCVCESRGKGRVSEEGKETQERAVTGEYGKIQSYMHMEVS